MVYGEPSLEVGSAVVCSSTAGTKVPFRARRLSKNEWRAGEDDMPEVLVSAFRGYDDLLPGQWLFTRSCRPGNTCPESSTARRVRWLLTD